MKILRWWAGPATLAATMLVAACGTAGSGKTSAPPSSAGASTAPALAGAPPAAATLARQVNSAMSKASSVHITATVTQGGVTVGFNASLTRSNEWYGQITYKNQPVTVLVTRGQAYAKVSAATLKTMGLPSAACVIMCGKYLKMSAGQSSSLLNGLAWPTLVGRPASAVPHHLHYVRSATVNGQPAWELSVRGIGAAYVAAQGKPYLLRLVKGSDRMDFTQWNSATIPPPPPASQVIDPSKLKHL